MVRISSAGAVMNGRLYLAGSGPRPAVVLLHGFPGGSDLGLGPALCAAGVHALFVHYRGAWGSGGTFTWRGAEDDAHAAVAFLRSEAAAYGIDVRRLALIGHSVGGWVALRAAAADPQVAAVASLAGTNLGALGQLARADATIRSAILEAVRVASTPDAGPIRAQDASGLAQAVWEAAEAFDLARTGPALRTRSVLLVGASADQEAPVALHHEPLVRAFVAAGAERLAHRVLPADHSFVAAGAALHSAVLDWLRGVFSLAPPTV
jgi:pimeloyl-ACP methyl ester carboxylesterase